MLSRESHAIHKRFMLDCLPECSDLTCGYVAIRGRFTDMAEREAQQVALEPIWVGTGHGVCGDCQLRLSDSVRAFARD